MGRLRQWGSFIFGIAAEALCPLIILAIVIDLFQVVTWNEYAGRDIQIYATIARYWQDGLIPYRDLWDFKPPLILVALRAGYALWGYDAESFHRVVVILTALGALTAYVGLRRAGCLLAAPLAALGLMTLVVANPWHVVSPNTELLAAVFGAAAFGCAAAYQGSHRIRWAAGSGACLALATLGKQPAVLWVVPVAAQLWLWDGGDGLWGKARDVLTRATALALGFTLVIGIVVAYFAWHGAAKALYDAVIVDGSRYAGLGKEPWTSLPWRPTSQLVGQIFRMERMWPFAGAIAVLVPLTILRPSRWIAVAWLWLLASYLVVVVGPRYEWHYLMSSFPALALTVGIVFEQALGSGAMRTHAQAKRRLVGAVLVALFVYGGIWRVYYSSRRDLTGHIGSHALLGLRIHAAARPGDTLFVKDEPFDLYLYAGMPPMTRFIYQDSPAPGVRQVWASALMRQPTFIFISHGTEERMRRVRGGFEFGLAKVLAERYVQWITDPLGIVYWRRNARQRTG
ncbi:MAG: hypothetical protein ACE5I7_08730 [Candidatus Binatia bacterium]